MKQNLRVSIGAVVLALATLAAVIFAYINFEQRSKFELVDDGVAWLDTDHGVEAWKVSPGSSGARAGIRPGRPARGHRQRAGSASRAGHHAVDARGIVDAGAYKLAREGQEFETPLVTAPAEKPTSIENYLRVVGLLYLFIGLFIFVRRWNAPRAVHFYVFCLVSFILYAFHYTGKLNLFDREVYWAQSVATLLAPALLVHFALVFPERSIVRDSVIGCDAGRLTWRRRSAAGACAARPRGALGFVPSLGARIALDQIELSYLGAVLLAGGAGFS